jgi:hypothetical protein
LEGGWSQAVFELCRVVQVGSREIKSNADLQSVMEALYTLGNDMLAIFRVEAQARKKNCFDKLEPFQFQKFYDEMHFLIDLKTLEGDGARRNRGYSMDSSHGTRGKGRSSFHFNS